MVNDIVTRMMRLVDAYDQLFKEFIEKLTSEYPRSTVVLFGSRARGDAKPSSDYDVIIIMDAEVTWTLRAHLYGLAGELPIDIIVIRPQALKDPIVRKMLSEGCRVIHDGLNLNPCLQITKPQ